MKKQESTIAVIGIGCRFPGSSNSPNDFWRFLCTKGNGVVPIPDDRWDANAYYHPDYTRAGKINVKWGGFLRDIDKFDAQFFKISAREAQRLDPQQRLLLETSCEALDDAGQNVAALFGKDVGVFIGISGHDYGDIGMTPSERVHITGHTITGGAASIAANRISYVFNFTGPSFAMDTGMIPSSVSLYLKSCS